MPTINIAPKAMQNGDNVTVYKDTVGPQQQTYTFLTSQERVILKNSGSKNITYTVGSQSGSLGPSQSVEVKETISSINLTAEQGTQQFEIWADESGTKGISPEAVQSLGDQVSSFTSSLAGKAKKTNGWIDITEYGAKGDGTMDCSSAFSQAVSNLTSGDVLFIPPADSHYKVTDEFTIPANVTVLGYGYGSYIKQYSREKNIFIASGDNTTFVNLNLEGDKGTNAINFTKNNGIFASSVKNLKVHDCMIHGFECGGVQIRDCFQVDIHSNLFYDNVFGAFSSCADILSYSGISGGRILIQNNFCLSNNSQGIFVNALGKDSEILIQGNICITLDSSFNEITTGRVRRHGILLSYNGNATDGSNRFNVQGNICRNTEWTGIYANGNPYAGLFNISGNYITRTGNSIVENSLIGGILLVGGGMGDIISNNIIYDNVREGMKISYTNTPNARCLITGNLFRGNASYGLLINNSAGNLDIVNNEFFNSTTHIRIGNSAGVTTSGNINIKNNRMEGNTDPHAIYVDIEAVGTKPVRIEGNDIKGNGAVGSYGIFSRRLYLVALNNKIENFENGIYLETYFTSATRYFNNNVRIDYNEFKTITNGIVTRATANTVSLIVEGNVFEAVTNKLSGGGGFPAAYIGRRDGDYMEIIQASNPTIGTWIAGDRRKGTTPIAGGKMGGICVTGGSPGTWKDYGLIDA
jgi:hypothetical protein